MNTLWFFWLSTIVVVHFFTFIPWRELKRVVRKALELSSGGSLDLEMYTKLHFMTKRHEAWMTFMLLYHQISWCVILMQMVAFVYEDISGNEARTLAVGRGFAYGLVSLVATYYRHIGEQGSMKKLCCDIPECLSESSLTTLTRRSDIAYIIIIVQATSVNFTTPCLAHAQQTSAVSRLFVSVINRNTKQAAFWNLLSAIASVLAIHFDVGGCNVSYLDIITREALTLFLIVAATSIMEQLAKAEAVSAVSAKSQQNECAAFSSILNATCDAVIHLNAQSQIVGPTPKLASLLLRGANAPTLDGMPFRNLLATERERASMAKILAQMPDENDEQLATAFQKTMRDQAGSSVRTRGFHTRYTDMDGNIGHLIGLSEASDPQDDLVMPNLGLGNLDDFSSPCALNGEEERPSGMHSSASNVDSVDADLSSIAGSDSVSTGVERLTSVKLKRRGNASDPLVLPNFIETSHIAKEMALWHTSLTWNFRQPEGTCCHFHAASRELQHVALDLARSPCVTSKSLHVAAEQCQACGLLNTKLRSHGDLCDKCVAWQPQKTSENASENANIVAL